MMYIKSILTFTTAMFVCSCTATSSRYEESLREVKSIATPGRSVHSVKSDLEGRGYEVSKPYDPTKHGKVLWMNVSYGSSLGALDGLLYASGAPDLGPPGSILVHADNAGTVIGVK